MTETKLEMAKRHVSQAESIIAEQRDRIAELERDGHDTALARTLLETYETTLKVARADLALFRSR